ncbi:hypothetical protein GIB67_014400 [Kingdonia uniflora]|uniref:Uncharacterized protein n=1 Tax=Kingdonia uniflora TaxID=39325 RepID=A0A7J7LZ48_9MAGN|nr:hypothetical protein GIB67_014400 [Kingdonia uniflora]
MNSLKQIMLQSVCSRYGLAIGAKVAPAVRVLVWISFLIAYPISKAGKGAKLTHDETTIIAGALQLAQKKVKDTITPISYTFVVDINAKLDRYDTIMSNYLALVLVLWIEVWLHLQTAVSLLGCARVPEILPLYNILNEFYKGHNHMAIIIRTNDTPVEQQESKTAADDTVKDVRVDIKGSLEKYIPGKQPILKWKSFSSSTNNSYKGTPRARSKKWGWDILQIDEYPLPKLAKEEEASGIITMEVVIEELFQEEIFDVTDNHYEDS